MTHDSLWEFAFKVAGAATAPLLADNPEYVFPAEKVTEAVHALMAEHGFRNPPVGYIHSIMEAPVVNREPAP